MEYNLTEIYLGYIRTHIRHRYMTFIDKKAMTFEEYDARFSGPEINTENFVTERIDNLNRVDRYMLTGITKDYPNLLNLNRQEICDYLLNNKEIYNLLDDIFARIFG